MNKNQRKLLKNLAKDLDDVFIKQTGRKNTYATVHNREVTNEDMELSNQEFEEGKDYMMKIPHIHEVNHFRRLKRSMIKYGSKGVCDYLKTFGFELDESRINKILFS